MTPDMSAQLLMLNGLPALLITENGRPIQTIQTILGDGDPSHIKTIYVVRNPDKLSHVVP
jgi:hypothetical protein